MSQEPPVERPVAGQLDPYQRQQMEALKILADWCRWVVGLEVAAIGVGITMAGKFADKDGVAAAFALLLTLFATCALLISVYWGIYIQFGLPEVVEQLPKVKVGSINDMASKRLSYSLLAAQRVMHHSLVVGMVAGVCGLIAGTIAK